MKLLNIMNNTNMIMDNNYKLYPRDYSHVHKWMNEIDDICYFIYS